eukprot:CAMPEP_0204107228 /NCGR_PEP_ID=MMETSP0361-20130328/9_1 /ASSEMBLY_ACC=CAM_ASM_000343 /TAXON_ID=268821 /ORGANISM="Scrippsiella Hangoei, Strain SHTV-5" /LENGTH=131 /DNA_ID=CAMNT_0051056675 /DNA_START=159 /DNA_END=554 /DNA_ORIENTATION=-
MGVNRVAAGVRDGQDRTNDLRVILKKNQIKAPPQPTWLCMAGATISWKHLGNAGSGRFPGNRQDQSQLPRQASPPSMRETCFSRELPTTCQFESRFQESSSSRTAAEQKRSGYAPAVAVRNWPFSTPERPM